MNDVPRRNALRKQNATLRAYRPNRSQNFRWRERGERARGGSSGWRSSPLAGPAIAAATAYLERRGPGAQTATERAPIRQCRNASRKLRVRPARVPPIVLAEFPPAWIERVHAGLYLP